MTDLQDTEIIDSPPHPTLSRFGCKTRSFVQNVANTEGEALRGGAEKVDLQLPQPRIHQTSSRVHRTSEGKFHRLWRASAHADRGFFTGRLRSDLCCVGGSSPTETNRKDQAVSNTTSGMIRG